MLPCPHGGWASGFCAAGRDCQAAFFVLSSCTAGGKGDNGFATPTQHDAAAHPNPVRAKWQTHLQLGATTGLL